MIFNKAHGIAIGNRRYSSLNNDCLAYADQLQKDGKSAQATRKALKVKYPNLSESQIDKCIDVAYDDPAMQNAVPTAKCAKCGDHVLEGGAERKDGKVYCDECWESMK